MCGCRWTWWAAPTRRSGRGRRGCASPSRTAVSASAPSSWAGCSRPLRRPTPAPRGCTAAPAWAWPFRSNWCCAWAAKSSCRARPASAHGKRVLLAGGHGAVRSALAQQLQAAGLSVMLAETAAGALDLLRAAPFDLLLIDAGLPDLGGVETVRLLRGDALLADLPVLLMAAPAERPDLAAALRDVAGVGLLKQLLDAALSALGLEAGAAIPPAPAGPSSAALRLAGARVLVVDDNTFNLQVAHEILQDAGVAVALADSGREAVRLVDAGQYDAVLMDIQMPDMDGYQATAAIRARPRHRRLPIIAMTAHAVTGYRESCLAMGMDDFVTKPFEPEQLFAALAACIAAAGRAAAADAVGQADAAQRPGQTEQADAANQADQAD